MCSIVGYIGSADSRGCVLEGLLRLEYRGYDSAGLAWFAKDNSILSCKVLGSVQNLASKSNEMYETATVAIGHTRWATHGKATEANAHPHRDCDGGVAVVHNGTIENFDHLKHALLKNGHVFYSETDTEVIAHLIEDAIGKYEVLRDALIDIGTMLKGAYTFVAVAKQFPDMIIAMRHKSPLCIGLGNNAMHVASDPFAFMGMTNRVVFMPDATFALITKAGVALYDFTGKSIVPVVEDVSIECEDFDKKGHTSFMVKEIFEQRHALYNTVMQMERVAQETAIVPHTINSLKKIRIVACGTSWHAALMAKHFFEKIAGIETIVHLASEFRHCVYEILMQQASESIYIFISQSGETADTLEAMRLIKSIDPLMSTYAVTNVSTSTLTREATFVLCTQAGREIAVASTKAFTSQVVLLYWFACYLACGRNLLSTEERLCANDDLYSVATMLENSIYMYKDYIHSTVAPFVSTKKQMIFLGRDISYPLALEAALKCNEIP